MKALKHLFLLIAFLLVPGYFSIAQEEETTEPAAPTTTMRPVMVKQGDGSHLFTIVLQAEYEDHTDFITDAEVIVSVEGDEGTTEIGKGSTDSEGYVDILVNAKTSLPKDEEGYFNFTVDYAGTEAYEAASESIRVKDFVIKLDAHLIDTVRMLFVDAYSIEADGSHVPFTDGEIGIFVQGMFSRLPLEPVWMDQGHGEIEFPADLVGDPLGRLKIYASLLEDAEYGNVEDGLERIWGLGYKHANHIGRELWTSEAPWWMVITLFIMILGVWGHYVFAMTQLGRIGRIGKDNQQTPQG